MTRKVNCLGILSVLIIINILSSSVLFAQNGRKDDFKKIFDGKTLKNWDGNTKFWKVEDGAITGQTTKENPTKGNTFIVWSGGKISDFELKLEYRIVGGNSGIQYRSFKMPNKKWVIGGYQADFEAGDVWSGALYGEHFRGMLAKRGQKTILTRGENGKFKVETAGSVGNSADIQAKIKKEDWNEYHIIAKGFRFTHKINGVTTMTSHDSDKKMRRPNGILALQLHAGPAMKVQFRNIRLKKTGRDSTLTERPEPLGFGTGGKIIDKRTKKKRKK